MRIIKERTLWEYCRKGRYTAARNSLRGWVSEIGLADWNNPAELKTSNKSASLIGSKRVVFNIKGNNFRLVADIDYKRRIVFIIWFGTHKEYSRINVKRIKYGD